MEIDKDKLASFLWIIIGLVICRGSIYLSLGNCREPGPGFLPFVCGGGLIILGIILFFSSFKNSSEKIKLNALWVKNYRKLKMSLTIISLLVYTIAIEYLGFLISTFIFMVFLLRIIEPHGWLIVILSSLAIAIASFLIFGLWFQLQFPEGIFKIF